MIHKDRLYLLADFLEKLPPSRFDFAVWVGSNWKGKPDLSCGTTACALGWAATIPEFRKLGLGLNKNRYGAPFLLNGTAASPFTVGHEIFGLDGNAVQTLFHPQDDESQEYGLPDDSTPAQVANQIREFVDNCGDDDE